MAYARIGEMAMYYEELGNPDATPLVLLHGAGGTVDDPMGGWADLAPSFAERYRVVSVEHRGHGRTNNPAGFMTFELIGDDVASLVAQLELPPIHIAGISDGGVVALDCALRRPELTRTITVRRPDRLAVDITDRDGTRRGFRFDGKQLAFTGLKRQGIRVLNRQAVSGFQMLTEHG